MATAILEQIAQKVVTRLASITVAGGYEFTVSEVVRGTRFGGFRPQHLQLVVNQGTLSRNEELSFPGNPPATAWEMPFEIVGLLMPSESDTNKIDLLRNQFSSDVVKALSTPAASWHNWDGLAILSTISDIDDITQEESSGFRLTMTVTYRTTEANPYAARN